MAAVTVERCRLMLYDFTARTWRELGGRADECIDDVKWSWDGKYLYFDSNAVEPAIYRLRISDRTLEKVLPLRAEHWLLRWIGLDPNDSPLVERNTGEEEIYALDFQAP